MKNPQATKNSGAASTPMLPENPNGFDYSMPATARFLTEAVYRDYHLTVSEQTRRAATELASAAVRSWGEGEPFAFSAATDDLPSLLMVMTAAMLTKNGRLTLEVGQRSSLPIVITTPQMDARTVAFLWAQRVPSRAELNMLTMRSRLAQAGGGR